MGWRKSEFPTRNRGPVLWIPVLLGFNVQYASKSCSMLAKELNLTQVHSAKDLFSLAVFF